MTPGRWLLVVLSFAAAAGVALWVIATRWPEGAPLGLPWWAHLMALGGVTFSCPAQRQDRLPRAPADPAGVWHRGAGDPGRRLRHGDHAGADWR